MTSDRITKLLLAALVSVQLLDLLRPLVPVAHAAVTAGRPQNWK